jgi:ribonuclease HI
MNGLKALRETYAVKLVTHSRYLKQGVIEYFVRWKENGWRVPNPRWPDWNIIDAIFELKKEIPA